MSRRFVYKWVRRFQTQGIEGLADLHACGTRRRWRPPTRSDGVAAK